MSDSDCKHPGRFCTTKEIAERYGLGEAWLRKLRQLQKGPRYFKLGRCVLYDPVDVETWLHRAMVAVEPKGVI